MCIVGVELGPWSVLHLMYRTTHTYSTTHDCMVLLLLVYMKCVFWINWIYWAWPKPGFDVTNCITFEAINVISTGFVSKSLQGNWHHINLPPMSKLSRTILLYLMKRYIIILIYRQTCCFTIQGSNVCLQLSRSMTVQFWEA